MSRVPWVNLRLQVLAYQGLQLFIVSLVWPTRISIAQLVSTRSSPHLIGSSRKRGMGSAYVSPLSEYVWIVLYRSQATSSLYPIRYDQVFAMIAPYIWIW